jgi:ribose transport system substrate-binding protein
MGKFKTALRMAGVCLAFSCAWQARASEYDDGATVKYYDTFKGKKVALIVISSGMDIAQGIAAGIERQSKDLGYDLTVRDYNWNNDQGA